MITPFVMRAFDRLADTSALMEIARSAPPAPDPSHTDRFMAEVFRLDGDIGSAFEDAKRDDATDIRSGEEPTKEEMFREVFEQILESIAHGGTQSARAVSDGDITRLMNTIRMVLKKTIKGEGRKRKSIGFRARLWDFGEVLSKSETQDSARDIAEFVREAFSGEMDRLVRSYWWSRSRSGPLKSTLLIQETGNKGKAKEQAEMAVFRMLLEGVRQAIKTQTYTQKPSDAAALGAIAQGVWYRIRNRETGDQYDGETAATSGAKYARGKWGRYIAPLHDTGRFGDRDSLDTLGITKFLNEHFLRRGLDSGTPVEVPLPGGGTMTAPSFRTELKHSDVHLWATAGLPGASLDAPLSDDDGVSLAETIGAPDTPYERTEEGVVEWLESPSETDPAKTNRDMVREDIRGWVDEAMSRVSVTDSNKDAVEDILLVKMGLVSSEAERTEFLERWLSKDIPEFRAEAIAADVWKDIGEPFKKGWTKGWKKSDGVPAPTESPYSKDWEQQALVSKATGEQFVGRLDALKDENQDNLEVVTKIHRKGDEPKKQHMLNWASYSQEEREADLNRAMDMYDGEQWFEQSVDKDVRRELERSDETLAEAFRKFRPESIFTAVAKGSDTEMIRAMGYVKPSVALETGKTPFKKHPEIYPDIKMAIGKLGEVMVEESKEDDGALRYLSLKRLGKVARRIEFESVILVAVVDFMEDS